MAENTPSAQQSKVNTQTPSHNEKKPQLPQAFTAERERVRGAGNTQGIRKQNNRITLASLHHWKPKDNGENSSYCSKKKLQL